MGVACASAIPSSYPKTMQFSCYDRITNQKSPFIRVNCIRMLILFTAITSQTTRAWRPSTPISHRAPAFSSFAFGRRSNSKNLNRFPLNCYLSPNAQRKLITSFMTLDQDTATGSPSTKRNATLSDTPNKVQNNRGEKATARIIDDDRTWQLYRDLITDVMERKRVIGKQLDATQIKLVQEYLLQETSCTDTPTPPFISASTQVVRDREPDGKYHPTFRDLMSDHRREFIWARNWTVSAHDYCGRCLVYLSNVCAKNEIPTACLPAWYKLRECGLVPREHLVSTYLYVLSMQNDADDVSEEVQQKQLEACLEIASFHDVLYEPNERTVVIRIKSLVAAGDAAAAERILLTLPDKKNVDTSADDISSSSWKRLRTFAPILQFYCDSGDVASALRLYREIRQSDGAYLDLETYVTVITAAARNGWFQPTDEQSQTVQWAVKFCDLAALGFSASAGPKLFDQLVTEMSEEILEIDEASATAIEKAFEDGFSRSGQRSPRMFVGRVSVNATSAICPASGAKLRLFQLAEEQKRQVHETLLQMASTQHEEYGEKLRTRRAGGEPVAPGTENYKMNDFDGTFALSELSKFSDFLRYRSGDSYTAIVDGPNVAYYGHGDVHWSQVQLVVEKLERMGERPLVVVPRKYIGPKFWLASVGFTQTLKENELAIINKLLVNKKLYVVPTACLDDYYWMLSSVAKQNSTETVQVPAGISSGRFPGVRPMLITNDQMRDHRFELLEPRLFRRWSGCHIVNYDIKPYEQNEWEDREVQLFPGDFFSREIQGNLAPDFGFSKVWHFPVSEWRGSDRLCISIMR